MDPWAKLEAGLPKHAFYWGIEWDRWGSRYVCIISYDEGGGAVKVTGNGVTPLRAVDDALRQVKENGDV